MTYEDSGTFFHQWATTAGAGKDGPEIRVQGYCAIPLADLKNQSLADHEIDVRFQWIPSQKSGQPPKVVTSGLVSGQSVIFEFSDNNFYDGSCSSEVEIVKLRNIRLGLGDGLTALVDLLRSQRTGLTFSLLEDESWLQGNASASFASLGVQYKLTQFNARNLTLAMTSDDSGGGINIRSANYLEYAEGTPFFEFEHDTFGLPRGFLDTSLPINHRFSATPIANGAQMIGCSSLIYEGELDRPKDISYTDCSRYIQKSVLKGMQRPVRRHVASAEEVEAAERQSRIHMVTRQLEELLRKQNGPAKRYAPRPNVFGTGQTAWTKSDVARGYVVFQRNIDVNLDTMSAQIIEHRYDLSGNATMVKFGMNIP
jgi:hypothetical protein